MMVEMMMMEMLVVVITFINLLETVEHSRVVHY